MRKVGRPTVVIATAFAVVLVAGAALVFGQTTPAALSWTALRNATYPTSVDPRGVILKDGLFEREAAPGSASKVIVRLADVAAFGTLDADATIDAAVVLTSSGGGSGTFVEVAAVRNASGIAQPVASVLLGDRVLVREVRVEDHQIVVRLRARDATDPFTQLTHEITR